MDDWSVSLLLLFSASSRDVDGLTVLWNGIQAI